MAARGALPGAPPPPPPPPLPLDEQFGLLAEVGAKLRPLEAQQAHESPSPYGGSRYGLATEPELGAAFAGAGLGGGAPSAAGRGSSFGLDSELDGGQGAGGRAAARPLAAPAAGPSAYSTYSAPRAPQNGGGFGLDADLQDEGRAPPPRPGATSAYAPSPLPPAGAARDGGGLPRGPQLPPSGPSGNRLADSLHLPQGAGRGGGHGGGIGLDAELDIEEDIIHDAAPPPRSPAFAAAPLGALRPSGGGTALPPLSAGSRPGGGGLPPLSKPAGGGFPAY